jgi:hypothetical protein
MKDQDAADKAALDAVADKIFGTFGSQVDKVAEIETRHGNVPEFPSVPAFPGQPHWDADWNENDDQELIWRINKDFEDHPERDYFAGDNPEQRQDRFGRMLCNDCGRHIFYDYNAENYFHVQMPSVGCFLIKPLEA